MCHIITGSINCYSCRTGFYGLACNLKCSPHCRSSSCDRTSGNCSSCDSGWEGSKCDIQCIGISTTGCRKCKRLGLWSTRSVCTDCYSRYYLSNGICSPCIPNCYSCNNNRTCNYCDSGYFGDSCTKCIDKCSRCTNESNVRLVWTDIILTIFNVQNARLIVKRVIRH